MQLFIIVIINSSMLRLYKAPILRPYVHRKPELLVEAQRLQELSVREYSTCTLMIWYNG